MGGAPRDEEIELPSEVILPVRCLVADRVMVERIVDRMILWREVDVDGVFPKEVWKGSAGEKVLQPFLLVAILCVMAHRAFGKGIGVVLDDAGKALKISIFCGVDKGDALGFFWKLWVGVVRGVGALIADKDEVVVLAVLVLGGAVAEINEAALETADERAAAFI